MATPAEIIDMVASLMNDTAQTVFTDAACLPYLNIAIDEMQEIFEHNNISITNQVSAVIPVAAGVTDILLPSNLVEVQQVWESPSGTDNWTPLVRKEFLPHYLEEQELSQFLVFALDGQLIKVPPTNQDNELKIDYIKKLIDTPITIDSINNDIPITNMKTYLGFHTASLCSMFISENPTRAQMLEGQAQEALARTVGIGNKGKQAITTRHRPFRASYKTRGKMW